jgi:hypothetical protein
VIGEEGTRQVSAYSTSACGLLLGSALSCAYMRDRRYLPTLLLVMELIMIAS